MRIVKLVVKDREHREFPPSIYNFPQLIFYGFWSLTALMNLIVPTTPERELVQIKQS